MTYFPESPEVVHPVVTSESPKCWRSYSQSQLDAQYNQSTLVANAGEYAARWAVASLGLRAERGPERIFYGAGKDEFLDLFHGHEGGPVHIHVHGGAWKALGADDASFVVRGLGASGATIAVLNFSLVPAVALDEVVDQVRRAMLYTRANIANEAAIFCSGHSSGAHLCTCLLDKEWRSSVGLPMEAIAGMVLASGPYDLTPVQQSARNEYLQLSTQQAAQYSPVNHLQPQHPRIDLFWGDGELAEFRRQSRAFAARLDIGSSATEVIGRNHFDMYDLFEDPDSPLVRAALAQMHAHY